MIIENKTPSDRLYKIIKELYFIHFNTENDVKAIPIIDDCCYDFVFFKEQNAELFYGDNYKNKIHLKQKCFTLHDLVPPYKISFEGGLTFFTIKLQPWANGHFFSNLQERGMNNLEFIYPKLALFYSLVFQDISIAERFEAAEKQMQDYLFELNPSRQLVKSICEFIYEKKGMVTVEEVSQNFQKSRQYLNRIFKQEVLYGMKKFIVTVRILDLVKYKAQHHEISLTELCYAYGYFDQPHFINDFKKVCGVTPRYFFNHFPEFLLRHL